MDDFLSVENAAPPPAAVAAPPAVARGEPTATVRANRTTLRAGPGTGFAALARLSAATPLTLVARNGDWIQVRTANGRVGWISVKLVTASAAVLGELPAAKNVPQAPAPQLAAAASARWIWPGKGTLTSRFGMRWGVLHTGIDIANRRGTPIVAARGGRVIEAGWCSGYGYCVKIDHGDGWVTEYGHMAWRPPVRARQVVRAGQLIGYMGMTYDRKGGGYASGNHVHFTMRRSGVVRNPLKYLP